MNPEVWHLVFRSVLDKSRIQRVKNRPAVEYLVYKAWSEFWIIKVVCHSKKQTFWMPFYAFSVQFSFIIHKTVVQLDHSSSLALWQFFPFKSPSLVSRKHSCPYSCLVLTSLFPNCMHCDITTQGLGWTSR